MFDLIESLEISEEHADKYLSIDNILQQLLFLFACIFSDLIQFIL